MLYVGLCALAAAVVMGLFSWRAWQRTQALKLKAGPLETARAGSVVNAMGRVVPLEELLTSPLAGKECVYFDSRIELYSCRKVTVQDDDGGWHEEERESTTVEFEDHGETNFVIEDATGRIKVEIEGAHVELEVDGVAREVVGSGEDASERTKTETYIEPGDLVRVVGYARGSSPRKDSENPTMVIGKAGSKVFLVTDKDKGELVTGFGNSSIALAFGAALLLVAGVLCLGISQLPSPEADPIKVDTSFKPLPKVKRPAE